MAPEVVHGKDGESLFSSDIWSLGATVFNAASGLFIFDMPPYPNTNDPNYELLLKQYEIESMQIIAFNLPHLLNTPNSKLNNVVNSCLNRDAFQRPSPEDIINYLEA